MRGNGTASGIRPAPNRPPFSARTANPVAAPHPARRRRQCRRWRVQFRKPSGRHPSHNEGLELGPQLGATRPKKQSHGRTSVRGGVRGVTKPEITHAPSSRVAKASKGNLGWGGDLHHRLLVETGTVLGSDLIDRRLGLLVRGMQQDQDFARFPIHVAQRIAPLAQRTDHREPRRKLGRNFRIQKLLPVLLRNRCAVGPGGCLAPRLRDTVRHRGCGGFGWRRISRLVGGRERIRRVGSLRCGEGPVISPKGAKRTKSQCVGRSRPGRIFRPPGEQFGGERPFQRQHSFVPSLACCERGFAMPGSVRVPRPPSAPEEITALRYLAFTTTTPAGTVSCFQSMRPPLQRWTSTV